MSLRATQPGERAFFSLVLVVLPLAFYFLLVRPISKRLDVLNARIEEADRQIRDLPNYQPLSALERKVLQDPSAPWRQRIPIISGDRAKLAHYDRIVSLLQRQWAQAGVQLEGVRSSWDPIQASFTLPTDLPAPRVPSGQGGPGELKAWVMEARIMGDADRLFLGLERLPLISPLLEPVGLRWESTPERHHQELWLRNLVLEPLAGVAPTPAPNGGAKP